MPRPKNKDDLLELSQKNYQRLIDYINSLSSADINKSFPKKYLNRNIRDVIAHLHEWNQMFLSWYEVGMSGNKPDMPAKGYSWKTLPDLNRDIQKKYSTVELNKVLPQFIDSFKQILSIIESHSETELFEKKRYHWTGSTSLAAYLVSATSSHYDWAYKLIIKCLR